MSTPKCPYFGKCGGCSAQHIDYSLQLENKKRLLAFSARVPPEIVKVFSGSEYGYRNRMDFIFHENGLGFREQDNWARIVDVEACVISEPRVNELLLECRSFFKNIDFFDVKKKSGTFRYAVIRTASASSAISFVLNEDSARLTAAVEKIKEFCEKTSADNVVVAYTPADSDISISNEFFALKGDCELEEKYLGKAFKYSAQGFFQNNHFMAEKMHEYVHEILKKYDTNACHLLDLYGGVGTFGIINSGLFGSVTTVESFAECTIAAKQNIELNQIKNVAAVCLDAKMLKKLELPKSLFVITDPPRSGMHLDTINELNKRLPAVIIYISCNLSQLSKDLPKFKDYSVKSAALFDLFPQTPHCEGVVELVLKK